MAELWVNIKLSTNKRGEKMILNYIILTDGNYPEGYKPVIDLGDRGGSSGDYPLNLLEDKRLVLWVKWILKTYPLSWISA